jgi:hypothetical protein
MGAVVRWRGGAVVCYLFFLSLLFEIAYNFGIWE